MDWNICLICQENTTEPVICPLNSGTSNISPYSSFLDSVNSFRALGMLPVELKFGEDMTVNELVENQGVWHRSCHLKFNKERLKRASKKRSKSDNTICNI